MLYRRLRLSLYIATSGIICTWIQQCTVIQSECRQYIKLFSLMRERERERERETSTWIKTELICYLSYGYPFSDIGYLAEFAYLVSAFWFSCSQILLIYSAFKYFGFLCTWWRLCQKLQIYLRFTKLAMDDIKTVWSGNKSKYSSSTRSQEENTKDRTTGNT